MGEGTAIRWTDHTFNGWWGCQRVSPACEHCYAETLSARYGHAVWGPESKGTPRRDFSDAHWREPLKWNVRAAKAGVRERVFCSSMSDVFEHRADRDFARSRLFDLIESTPALDWLLLTKRPERIRPTLEALRPAWLHAPRENVWLGTTVENQTYAAKRIPHLIDVPAVVHFLSVEPMLGPVTLAPWIDRLEWVIGGGESGAHLYDAATRAERGMADYAEKRWAARVDRMPWARMLRDECATAGIAFLWKQWGGVTGHSAGHLLDGVDHSAWPRGGGRREHRQVSLPVIASAM